MLILNFEVPQHENSAKLILHLPFEHRASLILTGNTNSPSKKSNGSPTSSRLPPLSDEQFRSFLDNVGQLVKPKELRLAIYQVLETTYLTNLGYHRFFVILQCLYEKIVYPP